MRKNLAISTCVLSLALIVQSAAFTPAQAFGFGKPKNKGAPLRAGITPAIQMPGEKAPNIEAKSAETATANGDESIGPPATKAQREDAMKADIVTQARFWVVEFAKNPKDEEAGFQAASGLERIGSYDKSIQAAATALQSSENSGRLWKVLGIALLKSNKPAEASRALIKSQMLMQKDAETSNYLGICYDNMGSAELAALSYNQARALAPNNPNYVSNLGFSLMMAGKFQEAEAILRQAIAMQGAPIQARQNLALAIGIQGRLAESEKMAKADLPEDMALANVAYLRQMLDGNQRWNTDVATNLRK